ncbi:hypothetical protein EBQ90_07000, partial [bacterium]|nr:hypothetical protein [bacterium]
MKKKSHALGVVWLLLSLSAFAVAPDPPEIRSNHRDLQEPDFFDLTPRQKARRKKSRVGKDFEDFGQEVAQRIDKIVSRKGFVFLGDPWTLQGIPLLFPSSDTGFNLGLNAVFANVKREDPHEMEIAAKHLRAML